MDKKVVILGVVIVMFVLFIFMGDSLFGDPADDEDDGFIGGAGGAAIDLVEDAGAGAVDMVVDAGDGAVDLAKDVVVASTVGVFKDIGDEVINLDKYPCKPKTMFDEGACQKHRCKKGCLMQRSTIAGNSRVACYWQTDNGKKNGNPVQDGKNCAAMEECGVCKKRASVKGRALNKLCEEIVEMGECDSIQMEGHANPCIWREMDCDKFRKFEENGKCTGRKNDHNKECKKIKDRADCTSHMYGMEHDREPCKWRA